MPAFDLLVLADLNPDLVVRGDDVEPAFGQVERLVDEAGLALGGSGAILACGAARLGLRVAVAGVVGDDIFGRFVQDALSERGIDATAVIVDPVRPTGLSVVLSRGEDRTTLTAPGTIAAMRAEMVDLQLMPSVRHLHASAFFLQTALQPGLAGLFEEARDAGATTSLDPGWDVTGSWDGQLPAVLGQTDLLLPNAQEALRIACTDDIGRAAAALAERVPTVAVKLGSDGGLAVAGDHNVRMAALPVDVADTTGAGDSFGAGFLAGRLMDLSLERSLALACACGSLSTQAVGGTAGQPTLDEAMAAAGSLERGGTAR